MSDARGVWRKVGRSWCAEAPENLSRGTLVTLVKRTGKTSTWILEEPVLAPGVLLNEGSSFYTVSSLSRPFENDLRPPCAECGRPGRLYVDGEDGLLKHLGCCDIPPRKR